MNLRDLRYLVAIAHHRHFGRAAEACFVSQPTLSSAVKSLEDQFGVLIVERGSRFRGFTPEGERILDWARRITGEVRMTLVIVVVDPRGEPVPEPLDERLRSERK